MLNFYENVCFRCGQTVYQVDRVGPLKDFTFFHQGCFKCFTCSTKLTLKTYFNNQDSNEDKEVYCVSHVPKIGPGHLDGSAVGIRSALNVPKSFNYVNEQIRGGGKGGTFDAEALAIKAHLQGSNARGNQENGHNFSEHQYGRFDASALHIAHALRATELQRSYQRPKEKPLDSYLVRLDCFDSAPFHWLQFECHAALITVLEVSNVSVGETKSRGKTTVTRQTIILVTTGVDSGRLQCGKCPGRLRSVKRVGRKLLGV